MDDAGTEDVKPFGEDIAVKEEEDEVQPEPDEELNMDQGAGRVWSVKIPKHLMERWSRVDSDDEHLATIRVYERDARTGKQRIVVVVPSEDPSTPNEVDEYEMDMVNEAVENQIVIAEREKEPGSRARMTILTGRIKHDCNLRPVFNENYRRRMRERHRAATTPARQTRLIDEVMSGNRGAVNMLSSGVTSATTFSGLVKTKPKPVKGAFERYARMPRNQLLDLLFSLYREKPRWSAKDLRTRTEQPEAYLKEALAEIADLHRSGEFNGLYELKQNFRDSVKSEGALSGDAAALVMSAANSAGASQGDVDMDDDEDEEDDDDEDMEEIS